MTLDDVRPTYEVFVSGDGYSHGKKTFLYVRPDNRSGETSWSVPLEGLRTVSALFMDQKVAAEGAEIIAAGLRQVEARLGVTKWSRSQQWLALWPEGTKGKKYAPVWSLCPIVVMGNFTSSKCGRPIGEGQPMCNLHLSQIRRKQERSEAWDRESRERREKDRRRASEESDLQELWAAACEARMIARPGSLYVPRPGQANVDSEILAGFLREIIERS